MLLSLFASILFFGGSAQASVAVSGNVPSYEIPNLQAGVDQIWSHELQTYLRGKNDLPPPEIVFYNFVREQESSDFQQWQKQWIMANPSIWLDWTQISGLPAQALTQDWIRSHVDTIFPFPPTFLAFHYDHTNRIQMNPNATWLRFYQNDPFGMKRETVGYGFYVSSHEMLHYILENSGVPGRLHHCLYVTEKNGHTLMGDMADWLVKSGLATPLAKHVGYDTETGLMPCSQLKPEEVQDVHRYLDQLAYF